MWNCPDEVSQSNLSAVLMIDDVLSQFDNSKDIYAIKESFVSGGTEHEYVEPSQQPVQPSKRGAFLETAKIPLYSAKKVRSL